MKTKNNNELNKIFLIMSVFAAVALVAGVEIGFELRDDVYNNIEVRETVDTTKAIIAEDNVLYESLAPRLTIADTTGPVSMYYDIQNVTTAELYVEKANIDVYDKNEDIIYSTSVSMYKTLLPEEKDQIVFQVPQQAENIAKVKIDFE